MFVYTVKLDANLSHHKELEKRFRMADDIYQKTLREILKRVRKQKKDPRYKQAYKLPEGQERNDILKELDVKYDLQGKFTFGKFANDYRNARNYSRYIPSDVANKLGHRAWEAYSRVKFAKGAHHINLNQPLLSFEAKGDCGLIIRNGVFKMGTKGAQFECPVMFKNDEYEQELLRNPFKYNRLVRKYQYGLWHYYVQMTFDGNPPYTPNGTYGSVGLDIGTSTLAVSAPYETKLCELAQGLDNEQENDFIARLQRKLDRQRRANNPDNYNEDGTIRRGPKKWIDSKEYNKTKEELAELQRQRAMRRRNQHQTLANEIVESGDRFVVEQMSFKGLQAKAKEATISETTGRYRSRKRYGRTIGHRAQAMLIEMIRSKAISQGKEFIKAETSKVKASQLDHITGQYKKVGLGVRTKTIGDEQVQRDLYSAFLLQHVENDGYTVNLQKCEEDFEQFLEHQQQTMSELTTDLKSTGKDTFHIKTGKDDENGIQKTIE